MGPLFILGFPRSGTTAMAAAISSTGAFGTYSAEGHFLYLFTNALERLLPQKLNPSSVLMDDALHGRFLGDFRSAINRVFSPTADPADTRWIDKSPGQAMVAAVPALSALYPEARFIYLFRPAPDAVRSNIANWPERLGGKERDVATRWLHCQRQWRQSREALPARRVLQVFQPDMLRKPDAVAENVTRFLDLSADEAARLSAFLSKNQSVNRPNHGPERTRYDAVALSAEAEALVREVCAEEVAFWPRLKKRDERAAELAR